MAIIKYKKGDSWVSIPMYVNTGGYVTGSQIKKINGHSLVGEGNINITVDLSNYYTKSDVDGLIDGVNAGNLGNYYTKGEIDSMIPSTEDFITEIPEEYITESELNKKGYLTEHQSLANYYNKSEVDAKISNAGNFDSTQYYNKSAIDSMLGEYATLGDIPLDYLTASDLSGYATQTWVNNKNYAKTADIPTNVSELINDMEYLTSIPSNYITETELEAALGGVISNNEYVTWDVELIDSSARLDITLFSYNAVDAVDNYSEIVNALENVGSSIQMTGSGFDATLNVSYIEGTLTFGIIKGRILYGTLTYLLSGKFIAKILTNNNDHIWILVDRNSYLPVDCLNVTYSLLKAFVDNGVLVPGRKYAITDYTCIYRQPVSEVEMEVAADDIKQIICTAITTTTLSETVEIVRSDGYVPIVECKYSIDPESKTWTAGMTSKSPKGVIWYMKDANGNECNYDFKHIKFRRWAITDITPNDTLDTGSGNPGAYAYCLTNTSYNWSDNRIRIGSGEATDLTIVENVFAGTWAHCIPELTNSKFMKIPGAFHSEYALYGHKPYKITSDSYIKYLAWTNDMTSSIGVNAPRSFSVLATDGETVIGSTSVYGNQKIIVSTSSYMDCYTFDYQGTDASERTKYNSEDPLVESVIISTKQPVLSNTCFIFTKDIMNNINTYLRNIYIPYCLHNTFLLRGFPGDSLYGNIASLICNDRFLYNLIITHMLLYVHFNKLVGYNYLCADFLYSDFGLFMRLTMFGYYQSIHTATINSGNLWYSSFSRVRYSSESSWVSPKDGMYTYDVVSDDFCAGNIMGPLQYAYFAPHFDRNTFRSFYNKGCRFDSNNQCCSLGECSYSNIGYAGLGLFIKYGKIYRSIIPVNSFVVHNVKTSTGVQTWPSTTPTVPDLYGVTVSANHASVSNISSVKNSVSTDSSTSGLPRKVLYSLGGGNWGTTYEHGLEAIVASTAVTANLEESVDLINNDYSLDAEMLK